MRLAANTFVHFASARKTTQKASTKGTVALETAMVIRSNAPSKLLAPCRKGTSVIASANMPTCEIAMGVTNLA